MLLFCYAGRQAVGSPMPYAHATPRHVLLLRYARLRYGAYILRLPAVNAAMAAPYVIFARLRRAAHAQHSRAMLGASAHGVNILRRWDRVGSATPFITPPLVYARFCILYAVRWYIEMLFTF